MFQVNDSTLQRWWQKQISFNDLRDSLSCSPAELAQALKIPHGQHVIACRTPWTWWERRDVTAILEARRKYDLGTVEMYQSRFLDHFFLHVVKRKIPSSPRLYFSLAGNGIELR